MCKLDHQRITQAKRGRIRRLTSGSLKTERTVSTLVA